MNARLEPVFRANSWDPPVRLWQFQRRGVQAGRCEDAAGTRAAGRPCRRMISAHRGHPVRSRMGNDGATAMFEAVKAGDDWFAGATGFRLGRAKAMTGAMTGRSPARSPNLDGVSDPSAEDPSAEASAPARSPPSPADLAFGRRIRQRRKAKGCRSPIWPAAPGCRPARSARSNAACRRRRSASSGCSARRWRYRPVRWSRPEDAALPDPYVTRHEREQPVIFERDGLRKRRISAAANAVFQGLMVEIEPDRGSGRRPLHSMMPTRSAMSSTAPSISRSTANPIGSGRATASPSPAGCRTDSTTPGRVRRG